jgi:hypothetical protein
MILLHKTASELEGPCAFPDTNLFMLIADIGPIVYLLGSSEQQPIEIV